MSRFDYVQYDTQANVVQANFKTAFSIMEKQVNELLTSPRAKALVLSKLEEAYMWIGKAIRDDQIARGAPAPLQEERNNS